MDIETFKQRYSSELDGLTSARITTLWKKSKTISPAELVDAIKHSRSAQDKQKRGKDIVLTTANAQTSSSTSEPPTMQLIDTEKSTIEQLVVVADVPTEWIETCARLQIDYPLLLSKVKSLHEKVSRIDELHSIVNDLLALREYNGSEVDVLQALS